MNSAKSLICTVAVGMSMIALAGCQNEPRTEVPTNASLATSGNSRLGYVPPADGTVWIYDVNNDRIIYSGPVMKGDAVSVDPDANRITIGGRTVAEKTLSPGGMNRVFFEPTSTSDMPSDHHPQQW